jgi:hypothetical protein
MYPDPSALQPVAAAFGHQRWEYACFRLLRGYLEMPLYFMHLRAPSDEVLDTDGVLMPEEAIANAALIAARDCMSHDLRSGHLELSYRIDIQDETGEIVHTLQFADAVTIIHA